MSRTGLRLGAIDCGGFELFRSGVRWLRPDGHDCRAGEAVAFCNIALAGSDAPFGAERFDLQVTLAPGRTGRLRHGTGVSRGGYLDRLASLPWLAGDEWAFLEHAGPGVGSAEDETILTFYAGRRFTDVAEDHSGLLAGWHDRVRAWTGDAGSATVLGAGTCELEAILRGEDGSFAAMLAGSTGPVQIAVCDDEPLVQSAGVLAQGLARTPADIAAIRGDIVRSFGAGGPAPTGRDWAFIGALLNGLEQSPLNDCYDQLGRSGLRTAGPAVAVCLSLTTEMPPTARHRTLGYIVTMHGYRLAALSPAVRHWLQHDFEFFTRSVDDIARDYATLAAGSRQLFVVNCMSISRMDTVQNYSLLDDRTLAMLSSVRAKELNLMLHDLERSSGIAVIDADAIAADLGLLAHFPDGFHATGPLIAEMRAELLHQLAAYGIPGFCTKR
ncbi:hypothetical protein [Novosphingobium lentum]|uniref:hypothetical protein n=1 Tax=Novosphingobium lentum TaxID=145287 RepID=UPI000A9BE6B7|nr:hypothetical protein [Novosphingobium lentum]